MANGFGRVAGLVGLVITSAGKGAAGGTVCIGAKASANRSEKLVDVGAEGSPALKLTSPLLSLPLAPFRPLVFAPNTGLPGVAVLMALRMFVAVCIK
jgi:hypothetical protein